MITYGSTTLTSYNSIVRTEVYYYKSTSATSLSDGSWATTKPTWESGKYIWQKIRTIYEDGTYTESDAVNITGQQGATGSSAYSYKLSASDSIITKSQTGNYSSTSITFSATYKQGTDAVTAYAGRFKIETSANGTTWTTNYISSANESSKAFTVPENILLIRCSLYQAGDTTVLLDIVTVPIVKDGVDAMGLKETIPYYFASSQETGITNLTQGWTRYKPELSETNKYLWVYSISRYAVGESDPELIEIKNDTVVFENHGDVSPVESCIIDINPTQSGTGDPSSSNIREITGWTQANIHRNENTITITFPEEAGTVYSGTLNVTQGTLIVDSAMIESYNSETLPSTWISDRDVYAEGTTPTVGAQVVYALETPIVYDISPQEIAMITGQNTIYSSTGQTAISYYDDQTSTEPYIDYTTTSVLEISADALSTATNIDNRTRAIMGICTTSATELNKIVTCENFKLYPGVRIQVYFSNLNKATNGLLTLNVNNTGNVGIYVCDNQVNSYNQLLWGSAGVSITFVLVKNNSNNIYWKALDTPYPLYGTCNTEADVQAKVVGCSRPVICKGTSISIKMTNTNTAEAATLNVASTGGKTIYANNEPLTVNSRFNWRANTVQKFVFDGQYWRMDDDSVKMLATAYITEINEDGIMVHPEDDSTSGWAISDAIQLFKNGISYIRLWIENNIPKIRIGKEDSKHVLIDDDSVDIVDDETVLASFGVQARIGQNGDNNIIINPSYFKGTTKNGAKTFEIEQYQEEIETGEVEAITESQDFVIPVSETAVQNQYTLKKTPKPGIDYPIYITAIGYSENYIELKSVAKEYKKYTYPITITEMMDGKMRDVTYTSESEYYYYLEPDDPEYQEPEGDLVYDNIMYREIVSEPAKGTMIPIDVLNRPDDVDSSLSIDYSFDTHRITIISSVNIRHISLTVSYSSDSVTSKDVIAYTFGARKNTLDVGHRSFAEGYNTVASGDESHAEGYNTEASGENSHAEGGSTQASGYDSHAEGFSTIASGNYSHAEGYDTEATNYNSHAEGDTTAASGNASHAEGRETVSQESYSHTEGWGTETHGIASHAEGYYTETHGYDSHAEGDNTCAWGDNSHAEGCNTRAGGDNSHAQNYYTKANSDNQTAIGKYNVEDDEGTYSLIIGNGTADDARSDAFRITWDGNIHIALDITATSGTTDGDLYAAIQALGWHTGSNSILIEDSNGEIEGE